jgi:hypothetical protein
LIFEHPHFNKIQGKKPRLTDAMPSMLLPFNSVAGRKRPRPPLTMPSQAITIRGNALASPIALKPTQNSHVLFDLRYFFQLSVADGFLNKLPHQDCRM